MVGAAVRKPRVPKDKTSYIACSYKLQPCSYHQVYKSRSGFHDMEYSATGQIKFTEPGIPKTSGWLNINIQDYLRLD